MAVIVNVAGRQPAVRSAVRRVGDDNRADRSVVAQSPVVLASDNGGPGVIIQKVR